MNITMFPMGFGESILLHKGDSCLLVDCGSESKNKNKINYFKSVNDALKNYNNRSLLITHFHSDHMNGLKFLNEDILCSFDNIYLPKIFSTSDKTLDLLIAEYLLEAPLDRRRKPSQIWGCLMSVAKANLPITLIERGSVFSGADTEFQALWPVSQNLESQKTWSEFVESSLFLQEFYKPIEEISDDTKNAVLMMTEYDNQRFQYANVLKELQNIKKRFDELRETYLNFIVSTDDVKIISIADVWNEYRNIKDKNENSIVFRAREDNEFKILMTGDVPTKVLKEIVKLDIALVTPQKKKYDIIKVPHHGTYSSYFDFSEFYDFKKMYISNGETTWAESKRGKVCEKYFPKKHLYSIVCHNTQQRRCEYTYNNKKSSAYCVNCKINDWK